VIVDGVTKAFDCFLISGEGSDANAINGLQIKGCLAGVRIEAGADNTTIGGSTASERNVISGNSIGVVIGDSGTTGNVIKGNYVGLNRWGTSPPVPNGTGVSIQAGAQGNTIGGTTEGERNVISGNTSYGIGISGTGNVVKGNYIGTNAAGTAALGNNGRGVISHGTNNTIGGDTESQRNVISGNTGEGVHIFGSGNTVKGNYIGTNAAGTGAIGNNVGLYIHEGAHDNTIGGAATGDGNIIAYNASDGVRVTDATATGNTIRGNSIHSNGGKGIELVNGGNMELTPPTIDGLGLVHGHTTPKCYPCTVEVFSDNQDEGRIYHGSAATNDDATGTWTYAGEVIGPNITATITHADGNTSEFSAEFPLPECGDVDTDGDTIRDLCDNCPTTPNPTQVDSDTQDGGDACDVCTNDAADDADADGICTDSGYLPPKTGDDDNCPTTPNPGQQNNVHPGTPDGDHCDDPDADLVFDSTDNCPDAYNPGQTNTDVVVNPPGDELGDVCDPGRSSPGYCSGSDSCPNVAEDYDAFEDADGCPDPDNDGDGFPDVTDDCPATDWTAGPDGIPCTGDDNVNTCEDYDGIIDTDGCHDSPGDDYDGDSMGRLNQQGFPVFWDEVEVYLGTDPTDACPDNSADDAWPLDMNKDTFVTVAGDVLKYRGHIGSTGGSPSSPNWWKRLDLNMDNFITVAGDALMFRGEIGKTCT
jgi:hypothetical protein